MEIAKKGKNNPSEKKKDELTFNERRAAQLWVEGFDVDGEPVRSKKDIAQRCGMTYQSLMQAFRKQAFLDEIDKRLTEQKNLGARMLMKTVPAAVERLSQIIESGDDRDAVQAATKLLNIAGFSEHKTVDININDTTGVVRGGFRNTEFVDAEYTEIEEET